MTTTTKSLGCSTATKQEEHTIQQEKNLFKIYAIDNYNGWTQKRIDKNYTEYSIDHLADLLETENKGYHQRIDPNEYYTFFGDCDKFKDTFDKFAELLVHFLKYAYDITIHKDDISYTENKSTKGSYHYAIPKIYCKCSKLKEIHEHIAESNKEQFFYGNQKVIDVGIYSKHWFRLPNQYKEKKKDTEHIIRHGEMEDFILGHILKGSTCIDDKQYLIKDKMIVKSKKITQLKKAEKIQIDDVEEEIYYTENNNTINNFKNKYMQPNFELFMRFFDECYKTGKFDDRPTWISIGHAIKNKFGDAGFELFDYYSSKGSKYDGVTETKKKYDGFSINDVDRKATIATLYYHALKDNKQKYIELIKKYSLFKNFDMTSTDIAIYIQHLKPNDFIWKDDQLYCFNGKFWERNVEIMKLYISTELHDFMKNIIVECFWDDKDFNSMKNSLKRLKGQTFKKEIVETTKEYMKNNEIEFDSKWWLFGFTNIVYDLKEHRFREYKFDDYISTTTGYDWIEPTQTQLEKVYEINIQILPKSETRHLYLTILSTGLEGRCLENLIISNGDGRNGKGFVDDLALSSFGNYGMIGNNAILFEITKTGSNPEKNNMHKKRLIIFREPPKNSKIQNSIYKELTGGGKFSARGHHETETEKKLHNTTILECNEKPLFAEEPTRADLDRIIDIFFESYFTDDIELLNSEKHIYKINKDYKTDDFREDHKRALLKILFEKYKTYADNRYKLKISDEIKQRTNAYLEQSCDILGWFKDNYEITKNKNDFAKLKDVFDLYKESEYYFNLPKNKKREQNYKYFIDYFSKNLFYSKYYVEKYGDKTNFLIQHIFKNNI